MFGRHGPQRVLKGQSTVELVLTLPLLLFLALFVIQIGLAIFAQVTITGAAKQGARVAAINGNSLQDGLEAARREVGFLLTEKILVQVQGEEPNGANVRVEVKAELPAFLPLLNRVIVFHLAAKAESLANPLFYTQPLLVITPAVFINSSDWAGSFLFVLDLFREQNPTANID